MARPIAMLALLLLALAGPACAQAEPPRRIVSLNLCADQYLVELADREQIAGLSAFARDPSLSFHAREAQSYPINSGHAEDLVRLAPDLVVASPYQRAEITAVLERFGLAVMHLPEAGSYAGIEDQTRAIAAAIGHPARGEALIGRMRAELAAIELPAIGARPTALHYQRQGYVSGSRTLLSEVMERAGLVNLAGRMGTDIIARVSLEDVLKEGPDFLVSTYPAERVEDLGTELLQHPALRRRYGPDRRLDVPEAMTVCPGPSFPAAVARLTAERTRAMALSREGGP
ncbi:MAG: ABC transporter substrate-binding protein [Alphaproteobacteria bacterium]|nr:ABC transporter substrate-binding protein [Alphaproteobacteria bacterium]